MAVLDRYLQSQLDHDASRFILEGGRPILFVIHGEEQAVTDQTCAPEVVRKLVLEIAPPELHARIQSGSFFHFPYEVSGTEFLVKGETSHTGTLRVVFAPSDLASIVPANQDEEEEAAAAEVHSVADHDHPHINKLFHRMLDLAASDMHLSCGEPPLFRVSGEMVRDKGKPFDETSMQSLLFEILPTKNREEFEAGGDTDFAYEIEGLARFRANYFRDRNGMGAVFRVIPHNILSVDQLGLPEEVRQLCFLTKGLVLVTGPTGSGKSTTLAALIDLVNRERKDHIITIEDPIEFVHPNKGCLINQREVRMHTKTFQSALRAALREDPDIILVGEMRDLETISIAIETAETGHLVFGTLHTSTAPSTVDRLIDVFPADRQDQIRVMLSESLKGVIAQTLCKKIGGGRVAAYEVLIGIPPIAALIREGKTYQIPSTMQTGRKYGMFTLNDSLMDLVRRKLVDPREAYMKAVDKQGLQGLFKAQGVDMSFLEGMGG